jgi:hypothetical protein
MSRDTKNFDVLGPSQEHQAGGSKAARRSDAGAGPFICYGGRGGVAAPRSLERGSSQPRRYRSGGTKLLTVPQAINMKAAVHYAELIDLPLNAHFTIHWVGTGALDDPDGKLFATVREGYARWLRRRGVPFAGIWCREKKSGGQAEVEHAHLIVHWPAQWLEGAKIIDINGGVEGCAELMQAEAALHRVVAQYAGSPDHYAVKVKLPTDRGRPGPYNGRSYDGLYLLKGGGPRVWRLFPRIRKEWRRPQGIIFGKRCGTTQNIGPAARRQHTAAYEYELELIERAREVV